ncbi:glycosyltransferase family 4 protein [Tautonia sociabilis]|uniref:Undecaprenyl/decaprenyl-phosphate alpha-N-acetylglucosaminyl 1-phosphate transferase n=1 Tax=Tautonia sociabilis TaxID=2080755 RepID=A0A432MM51_9BACT|nr:MraY family glycosyltransferase [Tautonia sociabilis]RUL88158.1 undecaprenyl/decaprenyl-phosphate alpha-N-acetylglucosaminyl 1-phosphate transferase [Tautonia sociabilis]
MTPDSYLLVFALSFLGCVLATPIVTRLAFLAGAIDRPDQFRRIHKGATPRLGGLGLAVGLATGLVPLVAFGLMPGWPGLTDWSESLPWVGLAAGVVLLLGAVDDTLGVSPRAKLLGQGAAVLLLYAGGIRIESVEVLGVELALSLPLTVGLPGADSPLVLDVPGMAITLLWFLGCMNVWNLIDGMDGLASGVGLLVAGTMMLVAIALANYGSALMAAALAGGLAGFLLYNWHPACIFLGDSGSLLIGMLIGVIGIQGSLKGTMAVSILLPILAMGLPISDTALAIFRRWVRNLPLTAADRRHVHHVLIGLGLDPRQAAALLYCFTAFLCGVVLLGVAMRNDVLALILGCSGCSAFVIILYSRRNELAELREDLAARMVRGRQERRAAKATWEAIQRVELAEEPARVLQIVAETAEALGCTASRLAFRGPGLPVDRLDRGRWPEATETGPGAVSLSGPTASFRLFGAGDMLLTVDLLLCDRSEFASDIAFRFLQRLSLASSERLGRLLADGAPPIRLGPEPLVDAPESPESGPIRLSPTPVGIGGRWAPHPGGGTPEDD